MMFNININCENKHISGKIKIDLCEVFSVISCCYSEYNNMRPFMPSVLYIGHLKICLSIFAPSKDETHFSYPTHMC